MDHNASLTIFTHARLHAYGYANPNRKGAQA